MRLRLASASDDTFVQLCRTAEDRALALGHLLGAWAVEGDVGRRAECTKCARAVYVRVEGTLAGMAGRAVAEPCD